MAIKKTVAAAGRSAARQSTVPARAAKKAPSPRANTAARAQQPIAGAEPVAPAPKPNALRLVSFAALQLGKNNPRKTYDPAALRELADSIKVKGVQQSLLVREIKGGFDVTAGQRRYRAIELLVKDGAWKKDEDRIPVLIGDMPDDASALAAALVENNQREDINPMEEAEGFARLQAYDIKKFSSAKIGEIIGRTERFVEKRIAFANRLCNQAQDALRAGKINAAQANALTVTKKPAEQKEALRAILNGWGGWDTEADIRKRILGDKPRMAHAFFKRDLYTGEVIEDPDDRNNDRAADRALFERLQREAIAAKAKELKAAGATVEFFDGAKEHSSFQEWQWEKAGKADAVTVIELSHKLEVKVRAGIRKRVERASASAGAGSKKKTKKGDAPAYTKTHFAVSRRIKTEALQRAVAYDMHAAMKLVVLSLLGTGIAAIRTNPRGREDLVTAPEISQAINGYLARAREKVRGDASGDLPFSIERWHDDERVRSVWEEFGKVFSPDDIESLFAHVVASRFGSFSGFSPELGDDPAVVAVAAELRVDMSDQPRQIVTDEWLESCRSQQLLELIAEAGIGAAVNNAGKGVQNMTQKALREGIKLAREKGLLAGYIPRTLRIGTAAELAKATWKATAPSPAKKPEPAHGGKPERRSGKSKVGKAKPPIAAAADSPTKAASDEDLPPTKAFADKMGLPEHLRRPDLRDSDEPAAPASDDSIDAAAPAETVIDAAGPAIASHEDLSRAPAGVVDPGEPPAFLKRTRAS